MKALLLAVSFVAMSTAVFSQTPPIEPGVSLELARWRAAHYSDIRYKLNLTLEKMSPVLKGTIEIRVKMSEPPASAGGQSLANTAPPIILDWRKIKGDDEKSTISNVTVNGRVMSPGFSRLDADAEPPKGGTPNVYYEENEHLIFSDGVVLGENVIKLDFTSPILTSGSAITRYIDKEDGSEYIYSLFVPSDASTAFPVFDQPDLKARFDLGVRAPRDWSVVSNGYVRLERGKDCFQEIPPSAVKTNCGPAQDLTFAETKPISTYVFAFAAGPWEEMSMSGAATADRSRRSGGQTVARRATSGPSANVDPGTEGAEPVQPSRTSGARDDTYDLSRRSTSGYSLEAPSVQEKGPGTSIYVRKSQAAKFKPHAAEVFRLNREAVKYFEQYFDYKFPFPKYDLVLIPEFPFGGMEHAGATFLRESSIIFPQEPTKNDYISRATLILHETAHQWFGDTVTMRWFDDLWLKEGFATFMAYKALEKIMPEANAWKVFYERVKQGAYQTDSTKGTTPIYQEIKNLSAAKSAYGNIVYNKAPAFLRQAEYYLGDEKFQSAVRSFLKNHAYSNATWEDLVAEFESASERELSKWATRWVTVPGLPTIRTDQLFGGTGCFGYRFKQANDRQTGSWAERFRPLVRFADGKSSSEPFVISEGVEGSSLCDAFRNPDPVLLFPNYQDYGYGIFLLDEKSRDYVLKNIENEKDPFLRSMMWGALWDSVREGELDPQVFVELVVKVLSPGFSRQPPKGGTPNLQKPVSKDGLEVKPGWAEL